MQHTYTHGATEPKDSKNFDLIRLEIASNVRKAKGNSYEFYYKSNGECDELTMDQSFFLLSVSTKELCLKFIKRKSANKNFGCLEAKYSKGVELILSLNKKLIILFFSTEETGNMLNVLKSQSP